MITNRGVMLFFICGVLFFIAGILHVSAGDAWCGRFTYGVATSLSERYDDNIDLRETNEEDDFITSLTPHFSLSYATPATDFTLNYNPSFEFYADNSGEDEIRNNGTLLLNSRITRRLRLTMTDTLAFTPGQDSSRDEEFTDRRRRSRSYASDRLSNDFTTTLFYQLFKRTAVRGGIFYRFDNYDGSQEVDSDEYGLNLGLDHQLTAADTLFTTYRYRILEYDSGSLARPANDSEVHSFSIGDTHRFPRDLTLTAAAGLSFVDEKHESNETEFFGQMVLAKNFQTGSLTLSFERDVSPGSGRGGTTTANTLDLTVRKEFSRRFSTTFSAYASEEESTSENDVDTRDWGLRLGSSYEFTRQLTGTVTCSFIRQDSKGDTGGDTDSYRARLYLDYRLRPNVGLFASYAYYQQNALDPIEEDIESNLFEIGIRITWL